MNHELKDLQEEFRRQLAEDNRDGLDMVRLQLKKEKKLLSDKPCRTIADTLDILGQTFKSWNREVSMGVMLDDKFRVICVQVLSLGTNNTSDFYTKDLYAGVVLSDAKFCVLVHNHPSGDCTPSRIDRQTHDNLVKVAKTVGFGYYDSIVLGAQTYYSFSQNRIRPYRRDKNRPVYIGKKLERCTYPAKRSLIHS